MDPCLEESLRSLLKLSDRPALERAAALLNKCGREEEAAALLGDWPRLIRVDRDGHRVSLRPGPQAELRVSPCPALPAVNFGRQQLEVRWGTEDWWKVQADPSLLGRVQRAYSRLRRRESVHRGALALTALSLIAVDEIAYRHWRKLALVLLPGNSTGTSTVTEQDLWYWIDQEQLLRAGTAGAVSAPCTHDDGYRARPF